MGNEYTKKNTSGQPAAKLAGTEKTIPSVPNSARLEMLRTQEARAAGAALARLPHRELGLPDALRARMEESFGTSFDGLRLFEDDGLAEGFHDRAYARGNEIHVAKGYYRPDSAAGQELLMHEAGHVVQDGLGRIPHTGGVVSDPGLEAQASGGFTAPPGFTMPVAQASSGILGADPIEPPREEEEEEHRPPVQIDNPPPVARSAGQDEGEPWEQPDPGRPNPAELRAARRPAGRGSRFDPKVFAARFKRLSLVNTIAGTTANTLRTIEKGGRSVGQWGNGAWYGSSILGAATSILGMLQNSIGFYKGAKRHSKTEMAQNGIEFIGNLGGLGSAGVGLAGSIIGLAGGTVPAALGAAGGGLGIATGGIKALSGTVGFFSSARNHYLLRTQRNRLDGSKHVPTDEQPLTDAQKRENAEKDEIARAANQGVRFAGARMTDNAFKFASGAMTAAGGATIFANPVVGLGLLAGAGVMGLAGAGISALVKLVKRHNAFHKDFGFDKLVQDYLSSHEGATKQEAERHAYDTLGVSQENRGSSKKAFLELTRRRAALLKARAEQENPDADAVDLMASLGVKKVGGQYDLNHIIERLGG